MSKTEVKQPNSNLMPTYLFKTTKKEKKLSAVEVTQSSFPAQGSNATLCNLLNVVAKAAPYRLCTK